VDARDKRGHDGKATIPFPWKRAIGLGLGVLRLSPDAFWRMTPRELALALDTVFPAAPAPLTRSAFDALRGRFPDALEAHAQARVRDG
jgi:uncharacterized phage protein (TIGR02216 family)